MKKSLIAILLASSLGISIPAAATGIPTFDAAQMAQMVEQIGVLKDQYEQLKQQYGAVVGSYGRGGVGLQESINSASVIPGSWQEVVAKQNGGAFASKQDYYDKILKTMPQEVFKDPKGQDAASYKLSTDSVRAAMAGGDALYGEVQTHLNNLTRLGKMVDSTTNIKDSQDLQNRIAVENGMLQSALAKMNSLNMNLQANLVNQQNQGKAVNEQHFRWAK